MGSMGEVFITQGQHGNLIHFPNAKSSNVDLESILLNVLLRYRRSEDVRVFVCESVTKPPDKSRPSFVISDSQLVEFGKIAASGDREGMREFVRGMVNTTLVPTSVPTFVSRSVEASLIAPDSIVDEELELPTKPTTKYGLFQLPNKMYVIRENGSRSGDGNGKSKVVGGVEYVSRKVAEGKLERMNSSS